MKKATIIFAVLCLIFTPLTVFAESDTNSQAANPVPKLIITAVSVPEGFLNAGEPGKVSVTIKNMSSNTAVQNVRFTLSDNEGGITKNGSGYAKAINAGKEYIWNPSVSVLDSAAAGNHSLTLSMEYDTADGQSGTSSEVFNITVKKAQAQSADSSQPRAMVTGYTVKNGFVRPGEKTELSVTIKNTSPTKVIKNIKISFNEEKSELLCDGMGTAYITSIAAGSEYVWNVGITASNTAASGEHAATISMDYEDESGKAYTCTDAVRIAVRQSAELVYENASLPAKLIQGEASSVSVTFINTGKSVIYNCMLRFEIDGVETGGTALAGTIEAGASKTASATLRAGGDTLGEVSGKVIITYEDDFGERYEETADVSSVVYKKTELTQSSKESDDKKNPQWWLFLMVGMIPGGAIGFGVPFALQSRKQRLQDEKTL